jgi:hypothetical protein
LRSKRAYSPLKIKPLIRDAFYFEQHQKGITQNRFFAGVDVELMKNVTMDIGYQLETIRDRETHIWSNNDTVFIYITAKFKQSEGDQPRHSLL